MSLSRVNAVETLYAAFPALMYIDPSLGAPLLEPLFRVQAINSVQFAASDLGVSHRNAKRQMFTSQYIGSGYPNISAPNSVHTLGVERL